MPAVRGVNLRSGDLNEEYGLFLLRLLGAVAPVPRTEDVGVDAFLTLLHNEGALYRAGRTCMVQLKSHAKAVTVVYYDADKQLTRTDRGETDWLRNLEYPLFFGRVRRGSGLELYSNYALLEWFLNNPGAHGIGVCFEEKKRKLDVSAGKVPVVWLGPAVLTLSVEDSMNVEALQMKVDLMSEWVKKMQENVALFPLGMLCQIRWDTNCTPEPIQYIILSREPAEDEAERLLRDVYLRLAALSVERLYHGEDSDLEHLVGMFEMIDRDFPQFKFGKDHAMYLRQNIERLRERRIAYRLARTIQVVDAASK